MTEGYDYQYGVDAVDLDEKEAEYVCCTCLDRARIALEQSGQHHCAGVLGQLQDMFDGLAEEYEMDPNDPCSILRGICGGSL